MKVNGARIKEEMRKRRITQQELADLMKENGADINRACISWWINGKRGAKAECIFALSDVFCIPVEELTYGEPVKMPDSVLIARLKANILELEKKLKEQEVVKVNVPDNIVMCKDCKYGEISGRKGSYVVCRRPSRKVEALDWFCADGERRDDL